MTYTSGVDEAFTLAEWVEFMEKIDAFSMKHGRTKLPYVVLLLEDHITLVPEDHWDKVIVRWKKDDPFFLIRYSNKG